MSVGVLLMTHESMGAALVSAARHVLGKLPLPLNVIELDAGADPDATLSVAAREARALDHGDGVLVLTDLYGATPCNVALRVADGSRVRVVAGVNVPMLWRVLCYAAEPLESLITRAVSGGAQGVMQVAVSRPQNQTAKTGNDDQVQHQHQQ